MHPDLTATEAAGAAAARRSVLVIEDDAQQVALLKRLLGRNGWTVHAASTGAAALQSYAAERPAVVLLDLGLPDMNGLEVLQQLREADTEATVIVLTGDSGVDLAVEAMQRGAENFLLKPYALAHLAATVERAYEKVALRQHSRRLWEHQVAHQGLVRAGSVTSQDLARRIQMLALSDTTVLLVGERGTGKGWVARLLHTLSARTHAPFIEVNCAGLTARFLDSELFGHERGAFSEAKSQRPGLFEVASRGSLLLDEIGELASELQPKLIQAIDEGRFRRIGGTRELELDVRLIGATHRDLRADVHAGRFREDLFHRFIGATLQLPPLRERGRDAIAALATGFVAELTHGSHKEAVRLSSQAIDVLAQHTWPGNIRELKHVLEQAMLALGSGEEIKQYHLPGELRRRRHPVRGHDDLGLTLEQLERRHVDRVLRSTGGNRTEAARMLGISRVGLYKKLQRYDEEAAAQSASRSTAGEEPAAPDEDPARHQRPDRAESGEMQ